MTEKNMSTSHNWALKLNRLQSCRAPYKCRLKLLISHKVMRSVFHIVDQTHRSLSSLCVWGHRVSLTVTVCFNEITHTAALSAPTLVQPQWAASEQMLLLLNKDSAVDSSLAHTSLAVEQLKSL
ncbi:hypothetical protein MHYP_G00349170 [Metynnis hypsauchen]